MAATVRVDRLDARLVTPTVLHLCDPISCELTLRPEPQARVPSSRVLLWITNVETLRPGRRTRRAFLVPNLPLHRDLRWALRYELIGYEKRRSSALALSCAGTAWPYMRSIVFGLSPRRAATFTVDTPLASRVVATWWRMACHLTPGIPRRSRDLRQRRLTLCGDHGLRPSSSSERMKARSDSSIPTAWALYRACS